MIVEGAWGRAPCMEDGTDGILETEVVSEAKEHMPFVYAPVIHMVIPVLDKWDFARIPILYYGASEFQGLALKLDLEGNNTIGYNEYMQKTIVSILGRPLSGKDTQAAQLSRELPNAVAISTGEIIREVKATGPTHRFWPILGPHIHTMDAGVLIPDEAITQVFDTVVAEKFREGVETIIVTAYPRSQNQLKAIDEIITWEHLALVVVSLKTSESYMYAMHGTRDHGRADDGQETLVTREQEFMTYTQPVIDRLRAEGRLIELDAERPISEVQRDIQAALRPLLLDREVRMPPQFRR